MRNIAVIGSSGAIGYALTQHFSNLYPNATVHSFSSSLHKISCPKIFTNTIKYDDEGSIELAAALATRERLLDLVIVTSGFLHDENIRPEKALRDLSADKFLKLFTANAITPALIAKYFVPRLSIETSSIFAALSARVGSISDNKLGGWYSYRASKAALNMIIKNLAIETARHKDNAIIVGLHPGTVDSALSRPFQANVPGGKLFTAEFAAEKISGVISNLSIQDSGKCFAWDGQEIKP